LLRLKLRLQQEKTGDFVGDMAWYHRRKLEVYIAESHVINLQYFTWLEHHIWEINIPEQLAALERTANITEEMKYLLTLEEKRRTTMCLLNEIEKKSAVRGKKTENGTQVRSLYENQISI